MGKRVLALLLLACAVTAGVTGGQLIRTRAAAASAPHKYTLRVGDRVRIPAINQTCAVQQEAGTTNLVCARPKYHHQVVLFHDNILVFKAGHPDHPVWHGRP